MPSLFLVACLSGGHAATAAPDIASLMLATAGHTDYAIVIGTEAEAGEIYAAEELAYFLEEMTGAAFPIRRDDTPAAPGEIVIGHTKRKPFEDLPAELITDNWEGYTLLREGDRIVIIGRIPRGTLYGVYDFLDLDLGVRFLTARVNHVPKRPTRKVRVASRAYGPPLERGTIYQTLMGHAALRNRQNGIGFQVIRPKMLGGVKWVGRPTHSFDILVPQATYFKEHPEYYAYIDGARRSEHDGIITQLCLTNPNVVILAMNQVRAWMRTELETNPYNKVVARRPAP